MGTIIFAAIIIVVAATAVVVLKRRQGQEEMQTSTGTLLTRSPGDLHQLQPGDWIEITGYLGKFQVVGFAAYQEYNTFWKEFMLVGDLDATELYLGVESELGVVNLMLWHPVETEAMPGERQIQHEGRAYELEGRGNATYTSVGKTRLGRSGSVQYADYELEGGTLMLSFERFDGDTTWEASAGEVVNTTDVTVYPGS